MKKALLSIFALAFVGANAQMAPGSTAPDFTATDVYGNSHSLYADYLNEGKHVLLNISATWCGPCWNYHNTHALGDFYEAYGPNGSDEVMILYVEGASNTNTADVFGTGTNTWGDWTLGTPYPIIESTAIANSYQIGYYPTLYRICSEGILTEINQLTAPNLRNNFNTNCGVLTGIPNHAKASVVGGIYTCGSIADISANLKNYGNNNITSAVLILKEDGDVIATQNFSGNVAQFGSGNVTFNSVSINENSDYIVEIQSLNDATPHYDYGEIEVNVTVADTAEHANLQVKVYTDNYPSEISWAIKDSDGTVIANGGPYQAGTNDQWGGGGPDANTIKTHNISVSPSECYSIELYDAYNDGWINNSATAPISGLEVLRDDNTIVFVNGNQSFSTYIRSAAFKTAGTLGAENFQVAEFSVYPNPSTGIFNISTSEVVKINVVDITGKKVYQEDSVQGDSSINLSNLQSGVYLMNVSGESINKTEKLIIK